MAHATGVMEIAPGCQSGNGFCARIQPYVVDSMMPKTTKKRPIAESATPVQSIRLPRRSPLSSMITEPASRIATTTTLMRKPQRQEKCVVRNPPRIGPIAEAAAATPPQMPNAMARSWPRYFVISSDAVAGIIIAAPMPSMIDSPAMSVGMLRLIEAMSEPAAKIAAPRLNIRLRPKRSPRRPPVTVSAASVNEYAEMTHCRFCRVVCNSRINVARETLSSVVSMMTIASASERTSSCPHLRRKVSFSDPMRADDASR